MADRRQGTALGSSYRAQRYAAKKEGEKNWSCSPVECNLGILLLDCFLIFASRDWRHDVILELAENLLEGIQKDRSMKMDI